MWFFYMLIVLVSLLSISNTILLIGIAKLLIQFFDSQQTETPRRKVEQGLTDIITSQVPYHRQNG